MSTVETVTYTAWASTAVSWPQVEPGIAITSATIDEDGYTTDDQFWVAISEGLPDNWGQAGDDAEDLDERDADRLLNTLGFRRTGGWSQWNDQWSAEVEDQSWHAR